MAYSTDAATKHLVGMALKRHPWAPTKMLQLAMYSKCPKSVAHCHYSSLLAGISLENRAPSAKNGSATATITIKPERLTHLCVEQALLYPWMCLEMLMHFALHKQEEYDILAFLTSSPYLRHPSLKGR